MYTRYCDIFNVCIWLTLKRISNKNVQIVSYFYTLYAVNGKRKYETFNTFMYIAILWNTPLNIIVRLEIILFILTWFYYSFVQWDPLNAKKVVLKNKPVWTMWNCMVSMATNNANIKNGGTLTKLLISQLLFILGY